jgi:methionyl-tRNA synthetase
MNEVFPVLYCESCERDQTHKEIEGFDSDGQEKSKLVCDICGEDYEYTRPARD